MIRFLILISLALSYAGFAFSKDDSDSKDTKINCGLTSTKDMLIHSPMPVGFVADTLVFNSENADLKFVVSTNADLSSAMIIILDKKTGRTLSSSFGGKGISLLGLPMIESYTDFNGDIYSIQCVLK